MAHPVILFDGYCDLCNSAVQFILKHDRRGVFRLAALQSDVAKAYVRQKYIGNIGTDSIVLLEDGKVYTRSTAALRIARRLSGAWVVLYAFILVPTVIRDYFYDLVAKNRYRVWGRRDSCMLPDPNDKKRFL